MAGAAPQAVLYRILGNDLPPRYTAGQTLANLRFTLEHEEELPGLEKRWMLNRIVDPQVQEELQRTIEAAGQRCDLIPFRMEEYRQAWTDLGATPPECHPWSEEFQQLDALAQARIADYIGRAKNLYLMNNNGARNRALELGFMDAEWVLPWDGGCFLPAWAWEELQAALVRPGLSYLCIPMHRLRDLSHLPTAEESDQLELVEPQLAFARHAALRFDPTLRYGSGPKWQVLQRIGLPGPWQQTQGWLPWEVVDTAPAPDAGAWLEAGLVLRLSGEAQDGRFADENALWRMRFAAIRRFTRRVDVEDVRQQLALHRYRCWSQLENPGKRDDPVFQVEVAAQAARAYSGAPFPARDGREAPPLAAISWLALDAALNGSATSRALALDLMGCWCLDPATAWDPAGLPLERATELGAIHPLLDAFTLLQEAGAFSPEQWQQLQAWCMCLLEWLSHDAALFLRQHHGQPAATWQHLLILSLAAFLDSPEDCCQVLDNLPGLLVSQRGRSDDALNLQAWRQLDGFCACLGRDLAWHHIRGAQRLEPEQIFVVQ